jgi:(2Fe-2S) ferredoxin
MIGAAVLLVLGAAPQDKPTTGSVPSEIQAGVKPPNVELAELNYAIRQSLSKGRGKDAERERAAQFQDGRRQLSEFIQKYEGKPDALSARVMRATLWLATGERGEAARDLEPVLSALTGPQTGPLLFLKLEALRWYCEADPAKARPLVEALASGSQAEKDKMPGLLLKVDAAARLREGKAIDGSDVSNTSYPGKVVLIHFWKSSSGESVDELRALKKLYRARHGEGFEIVGISLDEKKIRTPPGGGEPAGEGADGLRRFVEEFGIPWAQIYDGAGMDSAMALTFNVGNLPWNILVDRKGKIRGLGVAIDELPRKVGNLVGER